MTPAGSQRHIGHVVLSLDVGGLERVVATLAQAQRAAGARVTVYCLDRAGALASPLPAAGVPVLTVGRPARGFSPAAVFRLARMFARDHIDVVHCHNAGALYYGAPAARLERKPAVYTVHGAVTSQRRVTRHFQNLGLVQDVVFVSEHARGMALQAKAVNKRGLHTVLNGIDVARFDGCADGGRSLRRELGFDEHTPVCGIVARLSPEKDHANLFDGVARVRERGMALHCLVVGDGPLRAELEHDVSARGLAGAVHFLGARHDIDACLGAMNVFVLSSVTEGLAMTLLEAMAASRPVVATRVGGNPEVIVDGASGFLVPPRDAGALADAIERVLRDPAHAAAMGAAGRQRAAQRFSLEAMVGNYAAIYEGTRPTRTRTTP